MKRFHLRRHDAESSRDSEEYAIVLGERVGSGDGVVGFGRGVHFDQDLGGEGLGDLVDGAVAAGVDDALFDGFGHLADVAVEGVDDLAIFGLVDAVAVAAAGFAAGADLAAAAAAGLAAAAGFFAGAG
eukprot:CAMPEP_0183705572 /NCGR_PEP_ID=MMETSP0737-20130205/2628_1 /TAXON_ID=385413 /ORGANISM="Thalassiosira miniscula, Strain CCMP1093" /LENGTH=127 /DNA_ID=CAMNT_0025932749 /DNA_START=26 /DNA_END=410 /DNA_ORIENTATION=-